MTLPAEFCEIIKDYMAIIDLSADEKTARDLKTIYRYGLPRYFIDTDEKIIYIINYLLKNKFWESILLCIIYDIITITQFIIYEKNKPNKIYATVLWYITSIIEQIKTPCQLDRYNKYTECIAEKHTVGIGYNKLERLLINNIKNNNHKLTKYLIKLNIYVDFDWPIKVIAYYIMLGGKIKMYYDKVGLVDQLLIAKNIKKEAKKIFKSRCCICNKYDLTSKFVNICDLCKYLGISDKFPKLFAQKIE